MCSVCDFTKPCLSLPHKKASRDTIRCWIQQMMIKAGIDINVYKPHSVRSTAASNAKAANASVVEIMQTAGWSSAATKHLQGPSDLNSRAVFSGADIHSISERQFKIFQRASNYNPGNLEKAKSFHRKRRRRVVLIPFKLYFLLPTQPHGF